MKLKNLLVKQLKIIFVCITIVLFSGAIILPAYATSADQQRLEEVERQLAEIRKKRQSLKGQINNNKSLSKQYGGEITLLNAEVQDLQLDEFTDRRGQVGELVARHVQ